MITSGGASPDLTIRRLRESEAAAFRELRLRALSTDPMSFASTFEKESKGDEEKWRELAHRAASSTEMVVLVAQTSGGALVGMVGSFSTAESVHLWGMWVEPSYRDHGVGGRLLDAILSEIETSRPSAEVNLGVVESSGGAIRLYRSRGFVDTGHVEPLEHTPGVVWHEMIRRRD